MISKPIYMDYAAATPLDKRVLAAMRPFFSEQFYNPSSSYQAAKNVRESIEDARRRVAHWVGAKPREVVFTAGATESINMAINGVMQRFAGSNVLVSATEHEAVLAAARPYAHKILSVDQDGIVNLEQLKASIDEKTVLVSISYANNEIATIQPLRVVAQILNDVRHLRRLKNNPMPLYLHTDASQAACYLPLHANRLGVDLMTLNGAKMYGPKQTGVLFVSADVQLEPLVAGGGQEMGLRSGTENVPGIIGFAAAFDIAQAERSAATKKVSVLRDELQRRLFESLPNTIVNGSQKKRLPHILNISWPGADGERLVMQLDEAGIMASTGSACAANKQTASHVLRAIGLNESTIQGSLRLSLGRQTTQRQVQTIAKVLSGIVKENII